MCPSGRWFFFGLPQRGFEREAARKTLVFFDSLEAADESLVFLCACGNIHEDMHKPVDKFEDGTFPCFSYMVY